jgi:hypothetical protein
VQALIEILADSVWVDAPAPFVSSTDCGGISAEFDTSTVHMSIEAEPGGELGTYVAMRGAWDWEGPLRDVPDGFEKWAWRLGAAARELT